MLKEFKNNYNTRYKLPLDFNRYNLFISDPAYMEDDIYSDDDFTDLLTTDLKNKETRYKALAAYYFYDLI